MRRFPLLSALLAQSAFLALAGCQRSDFASQPPEDRLEPAGALTVVPGNFYSLAAAHSGKCVEVPGGSLADGAKLQQMPCDGSLRQQWKLQNPSAGIWQLVSAVSGKCADVTGISTANGARFQQWACNPNGQANQKWILTDKGSGQYEFRSSLSNRCLDVAKISTSDGAPLRQWDCNGQAHWYACTGDALNYHLGNLKQFNRPIWLTEFSCLDQADKSVAVQRAYMNTALDILEKDPAVFRYAWFTGRDAGVPSIRLLGASGQLTELGQQYIAFPQSCKQ